MTSRMAIAKHSSPFLARREEKKKGFSLFSCGATPSRTVPETQPLQVAFSLLESRSEVPERADSGEGKWPGEGSTGQKKGKKDA